MKLSHPNQLPTYNFQPAAPARTAAPRSGVRMRAAAGGGGAGGFSPTVGQNAYSFSTPPPAMVNDGMGNYFEALRESPDRTQIPYAMIHLRPQILRLLNGLNRKLLSAIARYLVDNGGVASYVVNQIADYCVPVIPRSQVADINLRKIYDAYWQGWCKRADYTRRFHFHDLQRLICMAIDIEGDVGAVIVDEFGFPQVKLYDTFHIGTLTGLDPKDGVEIDDVNGILRGYNVVNGPVDVVTGLALKFIPADQMTLLYEVERYNNYRGYSAMRRGSNDLRDKNDLKGFLKLKEKIGAALAAVIQQDGPVEEDVWGDDTGPQGNQPQADPGNAGPTQQEKKLSLMELLGGDIPVIEGDLKQFVAQAVSNSSLDMLDMLDSQFCMGVGIPPAFFLDEKLTGPNVRSVLGKVQRKFNNRKYRIAQFVEWTWLRVMGHAIASGELPATPGWQNVSFQYTPINSIDLGDTMSNERADVLCGQMSETERYGNQGKDFEHQHGKIVEEIGVKLDSAKTLATRFSADPNQQAMILPAVLSRLGLVGQVATSMAIQGANEESTGKAKAGAEADKGEKKPAETKE